MQLHKQCLLWFWKPVIVLFWLKKEATVAITAKSLLMGFVVDSFNLEHSGRFCCCCGRPHHWKQCKLVHSPMTSENWKRVDGEGFLFWLKEGTSHLGCGVFKSKRTSPEDMKHTHSTCFLQNANTWFTTGNCKGVSLAHKRDCESNDKFNLGIAHKMIHEKASVQLLHWKGGTQKDQKKISPCVSLSRSQWLHFR